MREPTGNLVPVQGEDARPSYPWSPTLMPDRPISLRPTSSTPRLSTVLKAYGRSVSLSVSVRLWRSIPFWPSLEFGSLSIRTGQHRLKGPITRTISPFPFPDRLYPREDGHRGKL